MSAESDLEAMSVILNKMLTVIDELKELNKRTPVYDAFDEACEDITDNIEEMLEQVEDTQEDSHGADEDEDDD